MKFFAMKRNTCNQGSVRVFIYPKDDGYIGVCLDLDIVEEGKDIELVEKEMDDAIKSYVETIIENKLSDELLNRPAPTEYWKKYYSFLKSLERQTSTSRPKICKPTKLFTVPLSCQKA